ncbi:BLOC-1-related complex subunit 7-like [Ruditapes philippinarum]|uniref:BLOC-1-related complex subunit 7-like n=1 Tax=Ruditapes philippinarum TaxID=129788 RepID=UPI00295BD5F6|nr:BLOC-1-related complex subunit 7-like [Ruditapes philippinarum]
MSAATWNQETKTKLNEKVTANINDLGSLIRHVIRASKSTELLSQAAKNFASQESAIQSSTESLRKMNLIRSQFEYQQSAIERSMSSIDEIQDQLKTIQR